MKFRYLLTLLFVSLFTVSSVRAQLTAGFTASPTAGCAPLLVTFTNTTTPMAGTTFSWTFGTSGSSVLTSPSTSFTSVGTHVVTLVATNGSSTSTFTLTITVYPPPTVSFVVSDTTICPGTPVTFTSTSSGGVPGPMTYLWNFGDGTGTYTGSPVVHTFSAAGDYTITLLVTNAQGCQATLVKYTHVHVSPPPVASFPATIQYICNPPGSVTFVSTSAGTPPLSYTWKFGDGSPPSTSGTHTYTAVGSYNVTLIVTDGNGCVDSLTRVGIVQVMSLAAEFTFPTTACVFSPVTFTNTSSPHSTRTWTYGDGPGSTSGLNGSHTYSAPGTYLVTLTIGNPPCTHTVSHSITILPGPTADFTISPADPCPAPQTITYTGSGPAGTLYSWLYSPGSGTGTGSPATYTWPTNGVKTISMIVVDPVTGCRDTVTKNDTLYDLEFRAWAVPFEGCVPLTVTFGGSAITHVPGPGSGPYPFPLGPFTVAWGDGPGSGTGTAPTHTYTAVGIYTATVTSTTSNGCPVTDVVRIEVGAPPQVTFTATPLHVCYGSYTTVTFTATTVVGPVDEWYWVYGDGSSYLDSVDGVSTHIYTLPGIFTVSVTPYYHGCPGIPFVRTNYVQIDSPKAIIASHILCTPANRVVFGDSSLGDDSHVWIFGDGVTSTLDNPIHDYPLPLSSYVCTLATYNSNSGCRDTAYVAVPLVRTTPHFVASDTVICAGDSVNFTEWITGFGTVTSYAWYDNWVGFGSTVPIITKFFYAPGGYHTISLVIQNSNGCLDTITKPNYILVGKPDASFTGSPVSGCVPLTVNFSDLSTAVTGTSLITRMWNFGDGASYTGAGPAAVRTYTTAGTFNVRLIVMDNIGCYDTVINPSFVTVYDPVASFTATNTHPCLNVPITFNNTSSGGPFASVVWDFGDGSPTSTATAPVHSYSALGTYNVTLTVTDSHGCTDAITNLSFINVTRPNAAFTMSDSVSVCPPLTVNFTNTSTGASTYAWTFGDGGGSSALSPTNMYITSALYTVSLVATNIYGCKDTAIHYVNIFGYAGAFDYTPLSGCAPLTVHFSATLSNVPTITWDFSDGYTSTTAFSDTISHTYSTPGWYIPKLLLSDGTGCQNSSVGIDTIKVDAVIPKFVTNPHPVCIGMPFNFIDSSRTYWAPITAWSWTYDGTGSTIASPTHTINNPGTYPVTLTVTNGWGCTGTINGEVVIDPPPVVTASPDTVVCVTDPATLFGYGALTYTWQPASTIACSSCNPAIATPVDVTTYTVTGTDKNGCQDTAVVTVGLRTHTIANAWGDTAVCFGVPVQLYDSGGHKYLWLPGTGLNNNKISNPIATPPYTVIYMAIAQLGSCIPDTNYVTVIIYPLPTVDAGPDQKLLAGSTAQLQATGTDIMTYEWSPSETLSCTTCYNPVASMTMMTTYWVDVTSDHGCKAKDSVKILLYCDNSQVFIPNAFTPNGDGENDVFYPRGMGLKAIKTFRIYNRWGELLFERAGIKLNDAQNAWDGSYKGGDPKPDVYVYIMEAVCYTGEDITIKGDVTIIR